MAMTNDSIDIPADLTAYGHRAYAWRAGATRRLTLDSPLQPDACRAVLEMLTRTLTIGRWNANADAAPWGAALHKRRISASIRGGTCRFTTRWQPNYSAISDVAMVDLTLRPRTEQEQGTHIDLAVSGRSGRIYATAVLLPVIVLRIFLHSFPAVVVDLFAIALIVAWAYGYASASVAIGTDQEAIVALVQQVLDAKLT